MYWKKCFKNKISSHYRYYLEWGENMQIVSAWAKIDGMIWLERVKRELLGMNFEDYLNVITIGGCCNDVT